MTQVRRYLLTLFVLMYSAGSIKPALAISPWGNVPGFAKLYTYTALGFLIGQYRIEKEIRQKTKSVNPAVEQFIRAECKKIGLPEWQTVRIVEHPYKSMSTIDTLCLEKQLVDHITQTNDQTGMARAIIHHEAGHIKQRHIFAKAVFNPFLSTLSTYCAFKFLNYIRPQKISSLALSALDIGLYFYIISPFLSRICEWDADECIADEPRVLAGGIRHFAMLKQHDDSFFTNLEKKSPVGGRLDRWLHECELISTHPTLEKRIKRLQQRLAKHPNKHVLGHQELAYLLDPQRIVNIKHA